MVMEYYFGTQVATRVAYGTALAKLGKNNPRVIGMDGDTKNSTFSVKLKVTYYAYAVKLCSVIL